MIHWLSGVALILYLNLLATPQVAAAHAPHLTPLADSQLLAISPITGQLSLLCEQDSGDDNDNGLQLAPGQNPLYLKQAGATLPAVVVLLQPTAAHPVRAPPLYSLA